MQKIIKKILITIFICIYTIQISACSTNNGENELVNDFSDDLVTIDCPVTSPTGNYVLKMQLDELGGVRGFRILVVKASENEDIVFTSSEFYRLRDTSFLFWGDNDFIWLYNGDLGTFFWEPKGETWVKEVYVHADENREIEVPSLLKQLRPKYFQ